MDWQQLVHDLQISSASVSLALNFIFILLIIKKSPEQLGSYRYLMIYVALFEIFYSVVDVFVSPTVFSYKKMFLVIVSSKNHRFSEFSPSLSSCLWCSCFGAFMPIFCIQFIYRYFVVYGSNKIKTFNDYRIVFWIMSPIVFGITWGTNIYFFMGPKPETDNVLRGVVLSELDLEIEGISYFGPRFHIAENGDLAIDFDSLISNSVMMLAVSISLSCIIVLAIKIFIKIKNTLNSSTTSIKNKKLQSQTFYALVTQTLIPVILMHFPSMTVLAAAMLDINLGHLSGIVSITYAMFPALDPLPVMLIIQNYRVTLVSVISTPVNIFVRRQTISK